MTPSSVPTPVNLENFLPLGAGPTPSAPSVPATPSQPPPSVLSQPPRPSRAPQTVPSGSVAIGNEARVQQLTAQLVKARQELVSAQVELRTARGEADNLRAELGVAKGRIEELDAALKKAQSAPPAAAGDDLKVIKGIGPKYEKLLRAAGVTTLAQIAAWTETDIDAIAKTMGVKADKIRKDDWVGNAKNAVA